MSPQDSTKSFDWLGIMLGNSRLHWAWFQGKNLQETWESEPLSTLVEAERLKEILPSHLVTQIPPRLPIYIASVVPSQTALWQTYPHCKFITLEHLPLKGIYATLGIDRALAVWGAGQRWGFPCLVIDAGTGLTFTGVDDQRVLAGGAILPGLTLQLQSLAIKTAALPEARLPQKLPARWALETSTAIESGVIYTVLAGLKDFIQDWWQRFPDSPVALTGGDSDLLLSYLKTQYPPIAARLAIDSNLILWGLRSLVSGSNLATGEKLRKYNFPR